MDRKLVIFVDVDDTLVRTFGTKQIPMPRSADYVRRMHADGHTLYCWSRGGAEYSRDVANKLGIAECFAAFLPKPDIVLDDRLTELLEHCEFLHPNNAYWVENCRRFSAVTRNAGRRATNQAVHLRTACAVLRMENQSSVPGVGLQLEENSVVIELAHRGGPLVDFDDEEKRLHVTDPFFAFYLRWGSLDG